MRRLKQPYPMIMKNISSQKCVHEKNQGNQFQICTPKFISTLKGGWCFSFIVTGARAPSNKVSGGRKGSWPSSYCFCPTGSFRSGFLVTMSWPLLNKRFHFISARTAHSPTNFVRDIQVFCYFVLGFGRGRNPFRSPMQIRTSFDRLLKSPSSTGIQMETVVSFPPSFIPLNGKFF